MVRRSGGDDQLDELLDAVWRVERERLCRVAEARQVLGEQERLAAVDAQRLERSAATQQRLVVRQEHRRARIDEPAAGDSCEEQRHAGTGAPTAARSGRAFVHDSSISASGSESQTIPPPTQR